MFWIEKWKKFLYVFGCFKWIHTQWTTLFKTCIFMHFRSFQVEWTIHVNNKKFFQSQVSFQRWISYLQQDSLLNILRKKNFELNGSIQFLSRLFSLGSISKFTSQLDLMIQLFWEWMKKTRKLGMISTSPRSCSLSFVCLLSTTMDISGTRIRILMKLGPSCF